MLRKQDQVSRILHTQQSMKLFLGAVHRQPVDAPPTAQFQIVPPAGGPSVSMGNRLEARHRSFKRQIRDSQTWVPCAMCTAPQCSLALHYLHLPTLSKPWIPLCPSCASGRKICPPEKDRQ